MLGTREPNIYGDTSMETINAQLQNIAAEKNAELHTFQSNYEGAIVDKIQSLKEFDGIRINAAAYTHTSIAILDALIAIDKPFVEVHLSNVHTREEFRHKSYLSGRAVGVICGLGAESYYAALRYFLR